MTEKCHSKPKHLWRQKKHRTSKCHPLGVSTLGPGRHCSIDHIYVKASELTPDLPGVEPFPKAWKSQKEKPRRSQAEKNAGPSPGQNPAYNSL